MKIEIIGNYQIGFEPWRLIEVRLVDVPGKFDFGSISLPVAGQPEADWQVPWLEKILGEDQGAFQSALSGTIHACFFLYVIGDAPLETPAGPIALPSVSNRPARLSFIEFEEP